MISPERFYQSLEAQGVAFLAGVPDSLLKEFCAYVDAVLPSDHHIISPNEGTAVALASGFHLATGLLPMVYLQNSGLGNTVNPLLSLADPEVYSLPMVVLVGWRGMRGVVDEPQHVKQGRVTPALLNAMEIPWRELTGNEDAAEEIASWATQTAKDVSGPVVLLVHKDAFLPAEISRKVEPFGRAEMTRERAIEIILTSINPETVVVSTTGMISRELYEQRIRLGQDRSNDFLTVGSMGHASQIALGIAKFRPELDVCVLDGDGAVLMHMGGMASIGSTQIGNLFHIVLNNGVHDSVGGQSTVARDISLRGVAEACGYDAVSDTVSIEAGLRHAVSELRDVGGTRFLEVLVEPGYRENLGRPKDSPLVNRDVFVHKLRSGTH